MADFATGDEGIWNWGDGTANGRIVERFTSKVSRSIKGTEVTRDASEDEPAFLIRQDDGGEVLKSVTEIEPA